MRSSSWRVRPAGPSRDPRMLARRLVRRERRSSRGERARYEGWLPVAVRAANGLVRMPAWPNQIISLSSPTGTEMLYAIGAGRQVKAVGQYFRLPGACTADPDVGGQPERRGHCRASARPRRDRGDTEAATGLARQLAAFRIPVLVLPAAARLADVYAQLDELGRATGHLGQAEA